jgi:GT2 family glycosyltransferase
MKKISIVTVNYNQAGVTEQLLHSIAQTNTYSNIEIIVVDNGSKINAVTQLSPKFNNVVFIRSDSNLGFAGGNNLGLAAATGDYFFLVNNDTEFTPGLIQKLADVLDEHPEVGMISPRINYFEDKTLIQYAGFTTISFYTQRNGTIGQFEHDNGQYNDTTGLTAYAHGAAMMVKREATDKAGMMFENYFLYYEEMDWCERIKRAGYQIWMRGDALIYHKESISVGKNSWLKEYFMNRNRILFARRNAPALAASIFYIYFMLMVAPRNILKYIKEKNYSFTGYLFKAIWWNITHKKSSSDLGVKL